MICFIFKENHVFIEEEDKSSDKAEEELDFIVIDGIRNLVDLHRLTVNDKKCTNLKVVVDGAEVTKNNKRKKKLEVLQVYRWPFCDKCYRRG